MERSQSLRRLSALTLVVAAAGFVAWVSRFFGESLYLDSQKLHSVYEAYRSGGAFPFFGFLGRPVAVLSFYADFYLTHAFDPRHLRVVNALLHIGNAALVGLNLHLLLTWKGQPFLRSSNRAFPLAALVAGLWFILPQSWIPVVYVIQRMVLLASLFTLLSLFAYFKWRIALIDGTPARTLVWLPIAIVMFALAVFSKESAASALFLIVVIETYFFHFKGIEKFKTLYFAGAIALCVVLFLLPLAAGVSYANKPFTMLQRLSIQPLVLGEYLRQTLLPVRGEAGIFYDGLNRVALVPVWLRGLAAAALLSAGIFAWRRGGIVALLLFGYLSLHIVEGTFLPLEMAFLHRNYLAAVFVVLAVVAISDFLVRKTRRSGAWALVVLLAVSSLILTVTNITAWTQPYFLARANYRLHEQSDRALSLLVQSSSTREQQLKLLKSRLDAETPDSLRLVLEYAYYGCGSISQKELESLLDRPLRVITGIEVSQAMANLVQRSKSGACGSGFDAFLKRVLAYPVKDPSIQWAQHYYLYQYLLMHGDKGKAISHLLQLADGGERKAAAILLLDRHKLGLTDSVIGHIKRAVISNHGIDSWKKLQQDIGREDHS